MREKRGLGQMRWIAGAALVAVMVAGGRVVCQEPWDDLFVGDSIADDWFKRAAENTGDRSTLHVSHA